MSWSLMTPLSYIVWHFENPVSSLLNLAAMSVASWSSVGQCCCAMSIIAPQSVSMFCG